MDRPLSPASLSGSSSSSTSSSSSSSSSNTEASHEAFREASEEMLVLEAAPPTPIASPQREGFASKRSSSFASSSVEDSEPPAGKRQKITSEIQIKKERGEHEEAPQTQLSLVYDERGLQQAPDTPTDAMTQSDEPENNADGDNTMTPADQPSVECPADSKQSTAVAASRVIACNEAVQAGLTCVCCGTCFSQDEKPYLLDCGHSICLLDLQNLVKLNLSEGRCIECPNNPKDHGPTYIIHDDVTQVPENRAMFEVLKDAGVNSTDKSIESLLNPRILCTICNKVDATVHCTRCPPEFADSCAECCENEHRTYVSRMHERGSISQRYFRFSSCNLHTKPERLYCKLCKKVACDDCKDFGDHRGHVQDVELQQNLAKEVETDFEDLKKRARDEMKKCQTQLDELKNQLKNVENDGHRLQKELDRDFKELHLLLTKRQNIITEQIKRDTDDCLSLKYKERQKIAQAYARFESVLQVCTLALKSGIGQLLEKKEPAFERFKGASRELQTLSHTSSNHVAQVKLDLPRSKFQEVIDKYGTIYRTDAPASSLPTRLKAQPVESSFSAFDSPSTNSAHRAALSISSPQAAFSTSSPGNAQAPFSTSSQRSVFLPSSPLGAIFSTSSPDLASGTNSSASSSSFLLSSLSIVPFSPPSQPPSQPSQTASSSPAHQAAVTALKNRNVAEFERLIESPQLSQDDLMSLFFSAVRTLSADVVGRLIDSKRVDSTWTHRSKNYNALHQAAAANSPEMINLLVSKNVPIAARDVHGATPMLWAIQGGCKEAAECLLGHGASLKDYDLQGNRVLHVAAKSGHLELVKWLVEVQHVSCDDTNQAKLTPLESARRKTPPNPKIQDVVKYLSSFNRIVLDD